MIDPEKLSADELVNIVYSVQRQAGYRFDLMEVFEVIRHTVRKAELNGKSENYIPILLENELRDFVMRKRINERGKLNRVYDLSSKPVSYRVS